MKKYIFITDKILKTAVRVAVSAETPADALSVANAALAERDFYLAGESEIAESQPPAEWVIRFDGELDEKKFICEHAPPLADDLWQAYRFLRGAGYYYENIGASEDETKENLANDDAPLLIKSFRIDSGTDAASYLQVRARFEPEAGAYNFQIEAILDPHNRGDLRRGDFPFSAHFEDKQYFISADDLPQALEIYETKFVEFIKLLHCSRGDRKG